ncbi:MAG: histidinol-phosphate transaminase [Limnohabitans sp.]|nr:histidinol-phosphate transaminase [Limnohabitans sp.]
MNIQELTRTNVKNMKPYSSARDEFEDFEKDMVFLDANENPFDNGINRYPDPLQKDLKAKIASIKNISSENIVLGNGSDEVLDLLFRAFCEPNVDNIITLPPTYGMYEVLANLNAIENREVLLDTNFEPNLDEIFSKINANTKIIFLCSPNNPTGNTFSKETVLTLLQNFNGIVLLDEAYIDFSEKESWLQSLKDYPNLVISQTLSKAFGMAGLRLGILYASKEIVTVLNKIKPPYNVNVLTQSKASNELELYSEIKDKTVYLQKEKDILSKALLQIKYIEKVYPSDTNFILIKVDDASKRYNQLLADGIVVRNRSNQPLLENCLRITVGTKEENNKLLTVLKSIQNA